MVSCRLACPAVFLVRLLVHLVDLGGSSCIRKFIFCRHVGTCLSGRPAPAVNPRNPADFRFWLHLPLLPTCQLVGTSWQAAPAPPPCPACDSGLTMVLKMRQVCPGKLRETPGRVVWWRLSLFFRTGGCFLSHAVSTPPHHQHPPCRFIAVA